ncbi:MAG: hypothetical protein ACR2FH_03475 [Caulobacteraceae bacterium]
MVRRIFLTLAAAAALATSAAVCVVALAFALYALVEPYVGKAGAAAIVAAVAAALIALAALFIGQAAKTKRREAPAKAVGGVAERVMSFVRDKPVVAVSAALGVAFMAIRNPRYLGAAVRAFFEGREPPRR